LTFKAIERFGARAIVDCFLKTIHDSPEWLAAMTEEERLNPDTID
jgi:hypothetical protein